MKPFSPFRLSPVTRYKNARYGSESPEHMVGFAAWLAWRFPQKLVKGAITLLLAAGLALGCQDTASEECDENNSLISCAEAKQFYACRNGKVRKMSCIEWCGIQYYPYFDTYVCDNESTEIPCDCNYGIEDGDFDYCTPEDMACIDEQTAIWCGDNYEEERIDCETWCPSQDANTVSAGCIADQEGATAPCNCVAPSVDGDDDKETDSDETTETD